MGDHERLEPPQRGPLKVGQVYAGRDGPFILHDRGLCNAANTAYLLGRPLLLTGEPGCGKTDFAWVVADALRFVPHAREAERDKALNEGPVRCEPLQCHVRSEMVSRDLLYHYDALLRFVDTHHPDEQVRSGTRDLGRYFELRGLGKALSWPQRTRGHRGQGHAGDEEERPVLLIDEIDKAPRDLPNDLLQVLEDGKFEVAELREKEPSFELSDGLSMQRRMGGKDQHPRPFVVITSNVEQQLPDPFLRRCVFFHIEFPGRDQLLKIVERRAPRGPDGKESALDGPLIESVVDVFLALRRTLDQEGKLPATSELLDWTEALVGYWGLDRVGPWLTDFAMKVRPVEGRAAGEARTAGWADLPGIECLVKLRDSLERVRGPGRA